VAHNCNSSAPEAKADVNKVSETVSQKQSKNKWDGAEVAEHLPSQREAQSPIPSLA
jgi:hypothetical protein